MAHCFPCGSHLSSVPGRSGALTSGDGAAVGSCFEFGHLVFWHEAGFVEPRNAFVVGWGWGKPLYQGLDKGRPPRMQEIDLFVNLVKPRANRPAVKGDGLAGVAWQDERLRWQGEEFVQAAVEERGARSRLLAARMQIRTPDTGQKER